MGRIHSNLKMEGIKYRATKNPIIRASEYTKSQLEQIGYSGDYVFGLWVMEPTGQTVQVGGVLSDEEVAEKAPLWDSNWCEHECDFGLVKGIVDPAHIYESELKTEEVAIPITVEERAVNERVMPRFLHRTMEEDQYLMDDIQGRWIVVVSIFALVGSMMICSRCSAWGDLHVEKRDGDEYMVV